MLMIPSICKSLSNPAFRPNIDKFNSNTYSNNSY